MNRPKASVSDTTMQKFANFEFISTSQTLNIKKLMKLFWYLAISLAIHWCCYGFLIII